MKVAVVGIGVMGAAIARRLRDTGAATIVYDADPAKAGALAGPSTTVAASARDAVAMADVVVLSLPNADVVESAVFGPEGFAPVCTRETLLIDMSSIDAGRTATMAARLLDERGTGWVDAPLSGGAPAAAKGTLTLMLGGREEDLARAQVVLSRLSNNFTAFGGPGAGQTVKLVNQILCAGYFMAVAEAVRFAEDHGVDATLIPAALAGGRGDSRIMQEFMAKMARRDFTPTGRIDNMLKDLQTVEDASVTPLPVTARITDIHRSLVAAGLGPKDSAEYMRMFDLVDSQ